MQGAYSDHAQTMDRAMRPRHAPPLPFLPGLVLLLATAAAAADSNKWRLQCSGGAESDGVIGLRLVPRDGEPIEVAVSIGKGTGENAVARAIRDALQAAGKQVEYFEYAGQGHALKGDAWRAFMQRAADFFAANL